MNIFKNKQTHEYKEKERYRQRKARIWGYKFGKKYGISDKIAKANVWADGHRRKDRRDSVQRELLHLHHWFSAVYVGK